MFCPKCGTQQADDALRCTNCNENLKTDTTSQQTPNFTPNATPAQPYAAPKPIMQQPNFANATPPPKPNNFLVANIIATVVNLCLCVGLIPGIIGIVMSAMSNTKYAAKDYAGAESKAKVAKILFFVSLGLALVGIIVCIAVVVASINAYGSFDFNNLMSEYGLY